MNYICNYALASYGISARRNRIWAIFNCMADGLTMITSRPVRKWAVLGYMSHLITIVSSDKTSPSTIYSSSITSTLTPTSSTWLTFLAPSIYLYLYLLITQAIARKYLLALSLSSAWRGGRCPISPERALSPLYPCPFVRFNPLRNDPA